MAGLKDALPDIHLVRRVITRDPGLGGEDYDAVTVAQFDAMKAQGVFAVHWGAHGLFYGIPATVLDTIKGGRDCLANFSRGALSEAATLFPKVLVLNLTATPETLHCRLRDRGRETDGDIARRLAQASKPLPSGVDVVTVANDGALSDTVTAATAALQADRS